MIEQRSDRPSMFNSRTKKFIAKAAAGLDWVTPFVAKAARKKS